MKRSPDALSYIRKEAGGCCPATSFNPVDVSSGANTSQPQRLVSQACRWARSLPGPTGPASFLMYESASGERFTVYTAKASAETTQMRYTTQDKNGAKEGALFWTDRGVGYVVSGSSDRERLSQVARLVYDQTEKKGG